MILVKMLNNICEPLITSLTISTETLKQPTRNIRKPWRPKDEWTNEVIKDYWKAITEEEYRDFRFTKLKLKDQAHVNAIKNGFIRRYS